MKLFHRLLLLTLIVITVNNFVWFALTYWAYLTTQSVIATATMGGIYSLIMAFSGFWFGSLVDHHKKKHVLLGSSITTFILFLAGLIVFLNTPSEAFASIASGFLWLLIVVLLLGTIMGTMYHITIPTLVPLLVPEQDRDKANGKFGTMLGLSFAITSVASGVSLAFGGMGFVLIVALAVTALAIFGLAVLPIEEAKVEHNDPEKVEKKKRVDIRGTIQAVKGIPGLFSLIFFTTFNNFVGGVFFALMDAYGLTLVSVEVWGMVWGILSLSFILGGLYVAKNGLGVNPLRILFRNNIIMWTVCLFFTIQPSIVLLAVGVFIWMFLIPFTEAIEQTIFQKVVPQERLGRVFGFAHSIEQAASPVTAFMIGPIAQFIFIPFMTTGAGVELIGDWYGTGVGRGIALVFTLAGVIGLIVTLTAMRSQAYAFLAARYQQK